MNHIIINDSEKVHAQILHRLMDNPLLKDTSHQLSFVEDGSELLCSYIESQDDEEVSVVLNKPTFSNKLFLTVTDGDPEKVARVMAHLEETDIKKCLHQSDIVRFDYSYLKDFNKIGVLLLNINVSPVFDDLESEMVLSDNKIHPLLVLFISQDEYEYKKQHGHDALMDYFAENDKDLVSIK